MVVLASVACFIRFYLNWSVGDFVWVFRRFWSLGFGTRSREGIFRFSVLRDGGFRLEFFDFRRLVWVLFGVVFVFGRVRRRGLVSG